MIPVNKACVDLIKSFEGLSLKAYHGAADKPGIYTIGYGTIQYPDGKAVNITDPPITKELAECYLKFEIEKKAADIDPLLRDDLTENQFAALISFAYNFGDRPLKTSTLRKKVNANPNDKSIRAEFMKWVYSDGKVWEGLKRRRKAEADLYFT